MRIEHRDHGEPTRIGHSHHADAAIVPRHVLEQPLDRIVRVGGLIDRLWILLVAHLAEHHELAFRLEPAADVLVHEDVAVARELGVGARERPFTTFDTIWSCLLYTSPSP